MSYLVLARKFRPQNFDDVVGQEHITDILKKAIKANRVAHSYLFCGPRGIGKTSCARILAKTLNCEKGPADRPCDKCSACTEILKGNSFDVLEIDGASNRGIDEIRALRENVKFAPSYGKYKIYIVDEVHMLTAEAFNALLKTLEEPPPHVKFIFATTEPNKVPATIISRCQRFDFKRLQIPEIVKKLEFISKKENVKFDQSALSLIAINSRGSFRDAESLLDQCMSFSGSKGEIKTEDIKNLLGIVEVGQIAQFVDFLLFKNTKEAIVSLNTMADNGVDLQEFAKTLVFYLRQSLLLKINPDFLNLQNSGLSLQELDKIKAQTAGLAQKDIQNILELFIEAENKMKYSAVSQLPLELAVVRITYQES